MTKRFFLLAVVMVITFTGGFISGILFSQPSKNMLKSSGVPQSQTNPEQKAMPKHEQRSKVLMGYVQDFRNPDVVDYSKLTHVIFSFAHPAKDGSILLNGDNALNNLRTMVKKAQKHDTKVILAVGGWYHIKGGESYEYFRTALADPGSRTKLVNELASFAERENLDGIDIDYEHPRSQEDAANLAAFMKQLSERLHPQSKELSIAVHSKIHSVTKTEVHFVVYEPSMFKHVDHVNIMAYDGQWDGGYNAANLAPYPFTEKIAAYWASLFDTHDIPKEKLVLGVPFYAQPEDPAIKQVSYDAIIDTNPDKAASDNVSMNGTTYHYNGYDTVQKKTRLALDHGFGGMMLWEAGHDSKGPYSLTAAILEEIEKADI
ncbi:glycoside hydrolase family 18 protein [Bacillus sp. T33-2]|uniref:glycoside hydrolase family 18 protein n=1 Tax=Bacillus sp. T33-2 TaxID=2054168 RepID=UPI000C770182|nr:glycoside hydrolase family 18 protein [Bacillus sp. T33-2]PLR95314.1 chitinase [Bacillus sp. T33-2]